MNVDDMKPIIHPIQMVCTLFGMSMNSLLILLILYRSPQNLGVYKYLMVYISVFELFFGILELMAVPDLRSRGSLLIVLTDPNTTVMPKLLVQATTVLYCGSFGLSLAIFGVQFVYRYKVFEGNISWTKSTPRNVLFWMGSPLVYSAVWAAGCAVFLGRNVYVDEMLRTDLLPNHYNNVSVEDVGVICVYFFPKLEDGTQIINWKSFVGLIITCVLLISIESIMLFSGVKCYQNIKELMGSSSSTQSAQFKQIQSQLFFALVSQTFIPIIFMQLPISAMYISIFANSSVEFFGILQMFTISLYLATDALPTILIVESFREAVIEYIQKILSKLNVILPQKRIGVGAVQSPSVTVNNGIAVSLF